MKMGQRRNKILSVSHFQSMLSLSSSEVKNNEGDVFSSFIYNESRKASEAQEIPERRKQKLYLFHLEREHIQGLLSWTSPELLVSEQNTELQYCLKTSIPVWDKKYIKRINTLSNTPFAAAKLKKMWNIYQF